MAERLRVFCREGRIIVQWFDEKQVFYSISWSITEHEAAQRLVYEKVKEMVDQEALRRVSDLYGGNGPKVST